MEHATRTRARSSSNGPNREPTSCSREVLLLQVPIVPGKKRCVLTVFDDKGVAPLAVEASPVLARPAWSHLLHKCLKRQSSPSAKKITCTVRTLNKIPPCLHHWVTPVQVSHRIPPPSLLQPILDGRKRERCAGWRGFLKEKLGSHQRE